MCILVGTAVSEELAASNFKAEFQISRKNTVMKHRMPGRCISFRAGSLLSGVTLARDGHADRWLARSISVEEIFGMYPETIADLKIM